MQKANQTSFKRGNIPWNMGKELKPRYAVDLVNGCWNWLLTKDKDGYGRLTHIRHGEEGRAHRIFWEKYRGEIPQGVCVLHKCDNRLCVNPSHLFLGTHEDNVRDRVLKGRSANQNGEKNHQAKLTMSVVLKIIKLYAAGRYNQYQLAEMFKVRQNQISRIVNGLRWKVLCQ